MGTSTLNLHPPASTVAQPDRAVSVTIGQGSAPRQDRGQQQDFTSFLTLARERFRAAVEAEAEVRQDFLEDLKFYSGKQWPDEIEAERLRSGRPCLTINRLPQFARLVINEQRQSRPAIQINPVEDGDTDTAQILQGLMRHIETQSQADTAYDTAFQYAVVGGFGYFRVVTDYVNDRTFDQDIWIKRILDPTTVYFDPGAVEPDYSDAEWCFVVERLTREQYRTRYKDSEVAGLPDFTSIGDTDRLWVDGPRILVAEYFFIERKTGRLVLLTDGREMPEEELLKDPEAAIAVDGYGEPRTRETEERIVHWCKLNCREILEPEHTTVERLMSRPQIPGKYIPIIPVLGEELIVDGHRRLVGVCRYAKDPQRMYNYMRSAVTEMIALGPKAPYTAAEGQIEGYEDQWQNANRVNYGVLTYKPVTVGGQLVPAPQRNNYEPPIQAASVALAQSDNDLKASTGIYDASLGKVGPEQSGKAILARQKQAETANFGLIDNLSRSMWHLGRVLLGMIPRIYDRPGRVVRIIGQDQSRKAVTINSPFKENGIDKIYDLTTGHYDVTVTVGPSYQSRRQEFVESVISLVQSAPQLMSFVADLLVRNMDWPGAQEIADRLKKMLPPQLQEQAEGQAPIPPEIQAKVEQLMQQHAALVAQLNETTQLIQTKKLELESRERIAAIQSETQLVIAELKAQASANIEQLRQEITLLKAKQDRLYADEPMPGAVAPQEPGAPEGQPMPVGQPEAVVPQQ